jgi:hypothetical protein
MQSLHFFNHYMQSLHSNITFFDSLGSIITVRFISCFEHSQQLAVLRVTVFCATFSRDAFCLYFHPFQPWSWEMRVGAAMQSTLTCFLGWQGYSGERVFYISSKILIMNVLEAGSFLPTFATRCFQIAHLYNSPIVKSMSIHPWSGSRYWTVT